jgi:GDP-L-fucose synthase
MPSDETSTFFAERRVLVTGGSGFLGTAVLARLAAAGADDVVAPSSADYDLRERAATEAMFDEVEPELVIHLAARVGGIGANQIHPSELYLDNLLMGTYVIDEAIRHATPQTVVVGTLCSYP